MVLTTSESDEPKKQKGTRVVLLSIDLLVQMAKGLNTVRTFKVSANALPSDATVIDAELDQGCEVVEVYLESAEWEGTQTKEPLPPPEFSTVKGSLPDGI